MLRYFLFLLAIPLAAALVSCQSNHSNPMEAKYKSVFVEVNKILDAGDVDKLDAYLTENVIDHQMEFSGIEKTGLAGVKEMFRNYHRVLPDLKTTIHTMAVSGDTLFGYISFSGTTAEPFMGMPAGHEFTVSGVDIVRYEGDKIAEHWGFSDTAEMMKMMQHNQQMIDGNMMEGMK